MIFLRFLVCKAAYLIEGDASASRLDRSEKVALDDLLAREEKQAVAPLLANVAMIGLVIYVPLERSLQIELHFVFIDVLVLEKLRVEHLAGEY